MYKHRTTNKLIPTLFAFANKKTPYLLPAYYSYLGKRNYYNLTQEHGDLKELLANRAPPLEYATERKPVVVETLANGATLASIEGTVPQGNITLFIRNAGSRSESVKSSGFSHLLKHFGFTRTLHRSPVRLTREFELSSSQYTVATEREAMQFAVDLLVEDCGDIYNLLLDVVRPRLREYIVRESAELAAREVELLDTRSRVADEVHRAAFRGAGLGNSLYLCPKTAKKLERVPLEEFEKFILQRYMPENFIFVSNGVDAAIAKELLSQNFSTYDTEKERDAAWQPVPRDAFSGTQATRYFGGDVLHQCSALGSNYVALAFEGVRQGDRDWPAAQVLARLLGAGSADSLVGAGDRGSATLAGSALLGAGADSDLGVEEFAGFSNSYSDSGLVGLYVKGRKTQLGNSRKLLDRAVEVIGRVRNKPVDARELRRAVKQTQVDFLKAAEGVRGLSDFVGRQILAGSQQPVGPAAFVQRFDVKEDELQRVAKKVFASEPTVVVYGDVANIPSGSEIKKSLS